MKKLEFLCFVRAVDWRARNSMLCDLLLCLLLYNCLLNNFLSSVTFFMYWIICDYSIIFYFYWNSRYAKISIHIFYTAVIFPFFDFPILKIILYGSIDTIYSNSWLWLLQGYLKWFYLGLHFYAMVFWYNICIFLASWI